jgi:hypothetical protein
VKNPGKIPELLSKIGYFPRRRQLPKRFSCHEFDHMALALSNLPFAIFPWHNAS